jgi:hypothetical protein
MKGMSQAYQYWYNLGPHALACSFFFLDCEKCKEELSSPLTYHRAIVSYST